jgi:hypothetical protein
MDDPYLPPWCCGARGNRKVGADLGTSETTAPAFLPGFPFLDHGLDDRDSPRQDSAGPPDGQGVKEVALTRCSSTWWSRTSSWQKIEHSERRRRRGRKEVALTSAASGGERGERAR